ncbi:hypothetical protein C2L92_05445 [Coxiella burnetii]|nr:hypothetical protein COXBURSA331_A2201 [Coxiella burnetii RSA 331]ARI66824.1 hypothetical protein B7L74_10795 [Coxiella burnetii]OYK79221.1 hypothetical protein CbuD7E6568_11265 [Coxiella burnetii]OYK81302.1 hypothetical protein CbuD7D7780_11285 [Coxiella burnetii]OYK83444.1 hypothetical protein CbuRSA315_10615 [Coxiella burnetii]
MERSEIRGIKTQFPYSANAPYGLRLKIKRIKNHLHDNFPGSFLQVKFAADGGWYRLEQKFSQ